MPFRPLFRRTEAGARTVVKDAERREAGSAVGVIFPAEPHFVLEAREKSRLEGRGCIFSRPPIVQVVAFRLVFGAAPGAVRLR